MSKKSSPKTEPTERKKPVRDPVRKLFMEKARIEFDQSTLTKKSAEEIERHAEAVASIGAKKNANVARLREIEEQLLVYNNQELFTSRD